MVKTSKSLAQRLLSVGAGLVLGGLLSGCMNTPKPKPLPPVQQGPNLFPSTPQASQNKAAMPTANRFPNNAPAGQNFAAVPGSPPAPNANLITPGQPPKSFQNPVASGDPPPPSPVGAGQPQPIAVSDPSPSSIRQVGGTSIDRTTGGINPIPTELPDLQPPAPPPSSNNTANYALPGVGVPPTDAGRPAPTNTNKPGPPSPVMFNQAYTFDRDPPPALPKSKGSSGFQLPDDLK